MSKIMKAEDRKSQVVEAAIKCFVKKGYHETQISDIIETAGIARGTFYLYFKGKYEIFETILEELFVEIQNKIKKIETNSEIHPAKQMHDNIERLIDTLFEKPAIAKIIFNEAVGLDENINKKLTEFYDKLLNLIERSINHGIQMKLVRNVNSKIASCIILGSFREIITQQLIFKNTKLDRREIIDGLLDVIIQGLGLSILSI